MSKDPFKKVLQQERRALEQDLLRDLSPERYPQQIDWLAQRIALDGRYTLRQTSGKLTPLDRSNFEKAIRKPYLNGLSTSTGNNHYRTVLDRHYPLGKIVIQYAGLIEGLARVNKHDIDPGEALGRLVARDIRRKSAGKLADIAGDFQADTYTPRALVEQVLSHPELADTVKTALPSGDASEELVDQLGEVKLATRLWDHQRTALCEWLHQGANGYVNMATATGKTVLGLAAVAYWVDSGELHPADANELKKWFGNDTPPQPRRARSSDVLIVTTDDLLGVQWARLFREHCNTPPEFTEVIDQTISLPWGDIDIRPANAVSETNPEDYRIAIFDEVHNYSSSGGWGENLANYIDSNCPVLALTGSVSEEIKGRFRQADATFPCVYTYTHEEALKDGVIPDFNWTLQYTPVDEDRSSTAGRLVDSAQQIDELVRWDGATYSLDASAEITNSLPDDLRREATKPHKSPVSLGRLLSGRDDANNFPEEIQTVSSGLSDRRTYWWNLRLSHQSVIDLVQGAMDNDKPTLVLTRSYAESKKLYEQLRCACDGIKIQNLKQGETASKQDKRITRFDGWDTDRKVLIGPGDRVGTGNDIQSVEVGINLARPGTGMSNSLIQRLGRLLRQPGTKSSVDFYHLLGLPPETSVAPMDGEQFIRNSAGFFAQSQTNGRSGQMTKIPNVNVDPTVAPTVQRLEQWGSKGLSTQERTLDAYERAYVDAIQDADEEQPVIDTEWYAELFDDDVTKASPESLGRTQTGTSDNRATSKKQRESTKSSPTVLLSLLSRNAEPESGAFVVLVGETARMHGRTNIAGQVGFDIEVPGTYSIASYTESGDVFASPVTIEELPTQHQLTTERGRSDSNDDASIPAPQAEETNVNDTQEENDGAAESENTASTTVKLPSEVRLHVEKSQEAFTGIKSPFTAPDSAYAAAIEAYNELSQVLDKLPSRRADDYKTGIERQLTELESLVEVLDEYGPALLAALQITDRSSDNEELQSKDLPSDSAKLAGDLSELKTVATELTVDTGPIEKLHKKLTESSPPWDDGEGGKQQSSVSQSNSSDSHKTQNHKGTERSVDPDSDSNEESCSQDSDSEADNDPNSSKSHGKAASTRIERVANHVFISSDSSVSSETRELVYDLSETLDEFDVRSVKLKRAKDVLSTIESEIGAIDTTDGVNTTYLAHVKSRVDTQRRIVEQLFEILIQTRSRVRLATENHSSVPPQELTELRERLFEGVELTERLNRDTRLLHRLIDGVDEALEDAEGGADSSEESTQSTSNVLEPDDIAPVDQPTGIQANEVSEWYDAVRNLSQITTVIEDSIEDVDASMQEWCETVKQFVANGRENHPSYGELQREHNEFRMSDYREVYGNGERTTVFHLVEVEPLTETIRTVVESVSDQLMDEIYLPVAPDSNVRLPVIVETPDELKRAVTLLDELPTSLKPAMPVDDSPLTDIGGVTENVAESLQNAGISSREQLISIEMKELTEIDGVSKAIALRIKMQVG